VAKETCEAVNTEIDSLLDDMRQIVFSPDTAGLDTRTILQSPGSEEDNVMLLEVVSFLGHERCYLSSRRQPHQHTLSVCTIGFLRLLDDSFNDNSLGKWRPFLRGFLSGLVFLCTPLLNIIS